MIFFGTEVKDEKMVELAKIKIEVMNNIRKENQRIYDYVIEMIGYNFLEDDPKYFNEEINKALSFYMMEQKEYDHIMNYRHKKTQIEKDELNISDTKRVMLPKETRNILEDFKKIKEVIEKFIEEDKEIVLIAHGGPVSIYVKDGVYKNVCTFCEDSLICELFHISGFNKKVTIADEELYNSLYESLNQSNSEIFGEKSAIVDIADDGYIHWS